MKYYKKNILILLIQLIISTVLLSISVYSADYTVVDNTNDWVHDSMWSTLIQIGTDYLNWTLTGEQAIDAWQAYVQEISWWWSDFKYSVSDDGTLSIWCTNNWELVQFVPVTPPPPPPPPSCSYVYSRSTYWSNCSINSNWTSAWNITCRQTSSYSPNSTSTTSRSCPIANASRPANQTVTKTLSLNLTNPTSNSNCSNSYANNIDNCTLTVGISWTTEQNRAVIWLSWILQDIVDTSWIKTNRVSTALWWQALNISWLSSSVSDWWVVNIYWIKSKAPFSTSNWTLSFKIKWLNSYTTLNLSWIDYNFKKPFIWNLQVKGDTLTIWKDQTLKLDVSKATTINPLNENYSISNYSSSLGVTNAGSYELRNINNEKNLTTSDPEVGYILNYHTRNTSSNAWIKTSPIISYNLWWENIVYKLWDYKVESYISSHSENWSDCKVSSNWKSNWELECYQTNIWNVSSTSCNSDSWTCQNDSLTQNDQWNTIVLWFDLSEIKSNSCENDLYANYSDSCDINYPIYIKNTGDSLEWGKNITWLDWLQITNITDTLWIKTNRVNTSLWSHALEIVNSDIVEWSWRNYFVNIEWIKSRAPFLSTNWTLSFDIESKIDSTIYDNLIYSNIPSKTIPLVNSPIKLDFSNIQYHFKKPFIWELKATIDGNNWNFKPAIWTLTNYKLEPGESAWQTELSLNNINWDYNLLNFKNEIEIKDRDTNLEIQDLTLTWWINLTNISWTEFVARINTSASATGVTTPWLQINLPTIEYKLDWADIKYKLSLWENAEDITPIFIIWSEFIWLKVVWPQQWEWKWNITWQKSNFSDLTKLEMRWEIRKNAYNLIKSMTSGQISNWVKYVEWDVTLSWSITAFETLIVKNWNVIINWDLNSDWNKLWIIVLQDWYDSETSFPKEWNVYVNNNVWYIDWIIYADGWFISSDAWIPYTEDSVKRTNDLKNQLVLKWSLFTRNTIWWAILAWWYYVLPWWKNINDFDKAMIYDLNYIRRWEWVSSNINMNNIDPFVIIYNSEIQTNPPKWFGK